MPENTETATEDEQTTETPVDGASTEGESTESSDAPKTLEEALKLLAEREQESAAQKRINRNLERRTKKDKAEIDRLTSAGATQAEAEQQVDADKIRAEAKAEARRESALDRAKDRAELALAGKVNITTKRAVLLLGDALASAVSDDGSIDEQAIADAVDDLLEENPGLKMAAQGGSRFQGGSDAGAREADTKSEEQQLQDAITKASADGNHMLAIQLKQRLSAIKRQPKKG